LQHNVDIKNKLLSIDMAKQTKKEAFTNYFPKISASLLGLYGSTKGTMNLNMELSVDPINIPTLNITTPEYTFPHFNTSIDYSFIQYGYSAGIKAIQPLFVGGQIYYGNRLAKIGVKAEELQLNLTQNEIKQKVEDYFWQIVYLQEQLKTIRIIQEQLTRISKDAGVAVQAGVVHTNDLLKIQLKEKELAAARLKVENGIRMLNLSLRQYTGIKERNFNITYDSLTMPEHPTIYYVNTEEAVNKRIENKLLSYKVEASELQTKMEIGKKLPAIAVGSTYMYTDLTDIDNQSGVIFGTLSLPLSDWWGGAHTIKKMKLQEQINRNEYQNTLELMYLQTEQAWNELNESYLQIGIAESAITAAQENLKTTSDCYQAGTATLSTLLEAQTLLQQAQTQFLEAYTTYYKKRTIYWQLTGR
jgi:outer membrane protein TolC